MITLPTEDYRVNMISLAHFSSFVFFQSDSFLLHRISLWLHLVTTNLNGFLSWLNWFGLLNLETPLHSMDMLKNIPRQTAEFKKVAG